MKAQTNVRNVRSIEREGFNMIFNLFNVVWMGLLTLVMFRRAKFTTAKRMMYMPMMMCLMEIMMADMLTPMLSPALTALLFAARLAVTMCCVGQLRREAAYMKRRARVRRLAREAENVGLVIPMFANTGKTNEKTHQIAV